MSKEAALAALSGTPAPVVTDQTPGLAAVETPPVDPAKALESTRFAHLAKKESEIVKQRDEMKREREQLQKDRENYLEAVKKIQAFEEMKKTDKIAAIKSMGFEDTDILNLFAATQEAAQDPVKQAAQTVQAEIKKFQDDQAAKEAETQKKQNDAVIGRFKKDITQALASDPDKYGFCNYFGPAAEELIYDTVAEVLKTSNEIISVQEAADMVESFYEEQDKGMSTIKKRTPAEASQAAKEQLSALKEEPPKATEKTLSGKATASAASAITRRETPEQKKARLIERLKAGV